MRNVRFSAIPLSGTIALGLGILLFFSGIRLGLAPVAHHVATSDEPPPLEAKIGDIAPDFTLSTVDGAVVQLSSMKGRPVILYFWASWCRYCNSEWPALIALEQEHKDRGLALLPINIMESAETIRDFATKENLRLQFLLDPDALVARQYHVRATPTYYFIDPNGIVHSRIIGQARLGTLRALVQKIVDTPVHDGGEPKTS